MSRISRLKDSFPLTNAFDTLSRHRYGSHVCDHSFDDRTIVSMMEGFSSSRSLHYLTTLTLGYVAEHVHPIQVLEQEQIISETLISSFRRRGAFIMGSSKPHSQRVFIQHVCCPSSSCSRHPPLDSRKRAELYPHRYMYPAMLPDVRHLPFPVCLSLMLHTQTNAGRPSLPFAASTSASCTQLRKRIISGAIDSGPRFGTR